MDIRFHGKHDTDEAIESMASIFKLFRERYGIADFNQMNIRLTLLNDRHEEVELIDAQTNEVLGYFEVHKTAPKNGPVKEVPVKEVRQGHLRLVVDNTR